MNKMLVASSLTVLRVTFMYNKVLTMVVVDSNLMTVICVSFTRHLWRHHKVTCQEALQMCH